ncbi:MAG: hypothetical protein WC565_07280 [Parcubacteria group bacterium]
MGRPPKSGQRTDWGIIEAEYVFGTETTYKALAKKYGVDPRMVEWHGSPKRENWRAKREKFLRDVRAEAEKRLSGQAGADEAERVRPFKDAYVESTQKMQVFLDMLLEKFIPAENASEKEKKQCRERLDALSPKELAGLIISGTDRLGGVAKVLQLLGGNPTDIFDIKDGSRQAELSPLAEAEIEQALRNARRMG